ncbi:MAG: BadF/BadG/BcrA/BcrD ATPase family protein [Propionibacteriaceae bacterium]|nr:BadF/BadG/BcrA/BcrD ATPase family protein [Propionibacteriaceae bacterium]
MPSNVSAIAIDAGGSTTLAVVVDINGSCEAVVRSGPGNPVTDANRAAANITDACAAALAASAHQPHMVVATVAGTLSRDFPELAESLATRALPTHLILESDLLSAYFSATAAPEGSVMVVGTGAVAGKVSGGRLVSLRDGLGWLLGDDGSGFWMGHRVARAVAADLDGRGPSTSLTPQVLEFFVDVPRRSGVRNKDLAALLTWSQSRTPVALAQLAILAARDAATDDVAHTICSEAAAHALATLDSLTQGDEGAVVLGGGVLDPSGPVGREVHARLGERARPVADGIAGAALMAVRELGGDADEATLARITRSLAQR